MKRPKIKYHPQMTADHLVESTNYAGDKNWVSLKCGQVFS